MKRIGFAALAIAAGTALATPAFAGDSCLSPSQVTGWTTTEQKNVIMVRIAGGHRFKMELSGQCPGLNTILALRVGVYGSGVCVEKGDYVSYRYHEFGEERCLITSVTPAAQNPPDDPHE